MKIKKEIKIGIFVVVVLVASFFVINYLRGKDIFNREMDLTAYFDDVEGLVPSALVQLKGYKVGQVASIEYRPDSSDFEVVCAVSKKFRIPKDSRITIFSTSIMGGKGILIDPGTSSEMASDGVVLQGAVQPDLVGSISENIGPLMAELSQTVQNLNKAVESVNEVLSDENKANVTAAISDLKKTLANIDRLSASLSGKTSDIENFITNLGAVSSQLGGVVEKADSTLGSARTFAKNLEKADVESLVKSVTSLSNSIQNPDGTIGRILKDGDIYESADSLITELTDLVGKIKENPKKYMKLSVF